MTSNTRPRRTRRTVNVMPCSRTTSPGFAGVASRYANHAEMVSRGGSSVKSRHALSSAMVTPPRTIQVPPLNAVAYPVLHGGRKPVAGQNR